MKTIKSKELAFFNAIGRLITLDTKGNSQNIDLSYSDLQKKLQLDRLIISSFFKKLKDGKILEIIKDDETPVSLNFGRTHEKLIDFICPSELDKTISEINKFIFNNLSLFNVNQSPNIIIETAKKIKSSIHENPEANLNSFIKEGIKILHSDPMITLYYSKLFFKLAKKIDKDDNIILRDIVYYFFNLPYEENPFITTFFLVQIAFQMEVIKIENNNSNDSKINKGEINMKKETKENKETPKEKIISEIIECELAEQKKQQEKYDTSDK